MDQQSKDIMVVSESVGKMIYILEEHGFVHSSIHESVHEICSKCQTLNLDKMVEGFMKEASEFDLDNNTSEIEAREIIKGFIESEF